MSTKAGIAPAYPVISPKFPRGVRSQLDSLKRIHLTTDVDSGYHLEAIQAIDRKLYRLLKDMDAMTRLMEVYSQDQTNKALENALSVGRNETQHELLSHPTSQYEPGRPGTDEERLYHTDARHQQALSELTRLAAVIFSDMVLFPLAWSACVKPRMASRMRKIMLFSGIRGGGHPSHPTSQSHTRLLLWILWFGNFGAFRSNDQEWLETELRNHIIFMYGEKRAADDLDKAQEVLRGFLWCEQICGPPGLDLWSRITSEEDDLWREVLLMVEDRSRDM
jgi:hypothetical protein